MAVGNVRRRRRVVDEFTLLPTVWRHGKRSEVWLLWCFRTTRGGGDIVPLGRPRRWRRDVVTIGRRLSRELVYGRGWRWQRQRRMVWVRVPMVMGRRWSRICRSRHGWDLEATLRRCTVGTLRLTRGEPYKFDKQRLGVRGKHLGVYNILAEAVQHGARIHICILVLVICRMRSEYFFSP